MTPRLIGFSSQIERQFFELFCSVPGLGVKKALKAMVRPVQDIAKSIEDQDVKSLTTLPGIGPAMAEKIVAQLRRKMAKFALLVQQDPTQQAGDIERSIVDETFQVLLALGHSESDARNCSKNRLPRSRNSKMSNHYFRQSTNSPIVDVGSLRLWCIRFINQHASWLIQSTPINSAGVDGCPNKKAIEEIRWL